MAFPKVSQILFYICTALMLALGCTSALAQYNQDQIVTALTTYGICAYRNPAVCWMAVANAPSFTNIAVGVEGDLWGLNSTSAYHYNTLTTGWDAVAIPTGATQLAVADQNNIYALSGGYIYKYSTSAGTWSKFSTTPFVQISVGSTGSLWGVSTVPYGCGNKVYHYNTSTGAFDFSNGGGFSQISAVSDTDVWGVCAAQSGSNVFQWNGSTWAADTFGKNMKQVAATPDGQVWGIDATLHYHRGNISWQAENGLPNGTLTGAVPTLITGARETLVYGLFAGKLYTFQAYMVQFTSNLKGGGGCTASGCSTTTLQHTGTATVQISGHNLVSVSTQFPANGTVNVSASATLTPKETYDCLILGCPTVAYGSSVYCPIAAIYIFNQSTTFMGQYFEMAYTLAKYTGTYTSCVNTGGVLRCKWSAKPWCTAATTPPDHNITQVLDSVPVYAPTYWDTWQLCVRLGKGMPWGCSPLNIDNALKISGPGITDNYPLASCTKTP